MSKSAHATTTTRRRPEKVPTGKNIVSVESAALSKAIGSMLPDGNTPMRVAVAPMTLPGQKTVTVSVVLGVRQPVPATAKYGPVTDTTELQITAYDPYGKPRGTQRHTAKVQIREGADGDAIYEVLGRIDLPTGRYNLRLAIFNPANGKSGSVFADVTIPDYPKTPFAVSPAVLSAWPPRISAPENLFWDIMPVRADCRAGIPQHRPGHRFRAALPGRRQTHGARDGVDARARRERSRGRE